MPFALNKVVLVNANELEEVLNTALEDSCALLMKHLDDMGIRADAYTESCHKNQIKNCLAMMMLINPSFDKRPYEWALARPISDKPGPIWTTPDSPT